MSKVSEAINATIDLYLGIINWVADNPNKSFWLAVASECILIFWR